MNPTTIGAISGILVIASAVPYMIGIYRDTIKANLTSWALWSVIGFAILLTYKSSGAEANIWPALFGFTNPLMITALAFWKRGEWTKPNVIEKYCIIIGLASLFAWYKLQNDKDLVQIALYLAIAADACAAIPTIIMVWIKPEMDRPFAWSFFAVGYGISIFAITENTFANYLLPIYMSFGALCIAVPLAMYRIKKRSPLAEWV